MLPRFRLPRQWHVQRPSFLRSGCLKWDRVATTAVIRGLGDAPVDLARCRSSTTIFNGILTRDHQGTAPGYSTAFALFEGLYEFGVRKCFVNVGSDHPSVLEALVTGKKVRRNHWPQTFTCPAEVTAISMADGYARVTGRPEAVIVHVDVGTQALAQGIHNASVARVPVFIFAGLCPFTESGELPGSRTEYMHWLQDAPDQKAIVRQYCRYTGEIRTGLNVKQSVARSLQLASSAPKGPVYLAAAREVLAQEIQAYTLPVPLYKPIDPAALPHWGVEGIAKALVGAKCPLILTGYSGRNRRCPEVLVQLADLIPGLRVHDTGGSDMCFPFSHPASLGFRLGTHECPKDADVILMIDCDVPWIPSRNAPCAKPRIYNVGVDPLNERIPVSFFPAHGLWKADSYTALKQIVSFLEHRMERESSPEDETRRLELVAEHDARLQEIASRPRLDDEVELDAHNVGFLLKKKLPQPTTYVVEAVTCSQDLHDQLQPSRPGEWINCGATGIGWSNGAALGVKLALVDRNREDLVCQVVGDGSFMCAAPSSAIWVGSKYKIPLLTVVLNNGGWKAPRRSTELVYPNGLNRDATDDEMNVSFKPSPNYAALAEAAAEGSEGWMKGVRVTTVTELEKALEEAATRVGNGRSMLIEVMMPVPDKPT